MQATDDANASTLRLTSVYCIHRLPVSFGLSILYLGLQ